jgi:hypothetical protein
VRAWVFALASVLALGCSKKDDVIVETGSERVMTADEIDRDPLALLPGGAVGIVRVDAVAFHASEFGQRMQRLTAARLPVPPSAGFEPARDLTTVYVGVYSMKGADFAMVATGRFDPAKIEAAADGTTMTPLGAPLVRATYADRTLYVSRNIGFTVLTARTVLLGNETGIRRALDRMKESRARREVPSWAEKVLEHPQAAVAATVDFESSPLAESATKGVQFVDGMKRGRILGNFEPPGMNFVATLTYADAPTADRSAHAIRGAHRSLQSYSFFMSLAGIKNPIRDLQVQPVDKDMQVAAQIEPQGIEWLLNQAANYLGVPPQTIAASTGGPAVPGQP